MGAVAATLASAVARPLPTEATTNQAYYVNDENDDWVIAAQSLSQTGFPNSGKGTAVYGTSDLGRGVRGTTYSGVGVVGESQLGIGVRGATYSGPAPVTPELVGVHGYSDQASARGVYGQTTDTTSETYGVFGTTKGPLGRAVFGWSLNQNKGGTGVFGQSSSGTGVGVRGNAWDGNGSSGRFGTGVIGSSGSHEAALPAPLPNTGVYGIGRNGRGVVADGDQAQLRLVPSIASRPPATGQPGDFFVDKSHRLWFCKIGGNPATWKLIA
jgi:hypothetical protein